MFREIGSIEEFVRLRDTEPALLAYFSTETCNVCKVLKPGIDELVTQSFPKMQLCYIRTDLLPEVAGMNQVFAVPTILVFFDGREHIRKSRNIGITELHKEILRRYEIMFS